LKFKYFLSLILLLLFLAHNSHAQVKYYYKVVSDTIPINFDNVYSIKRVTILPGSETILLRGKILKKEDYKFNYEKGSFALADTLPYSIYDTLCVTYQSMDISLKKEYRNRSLEVRYNDKFKDTIRVAKNESGGFSAESIFGSGMQKSGTLVRGFTVGTTKDFTLNSGLRLQLSGKLSDDIEIVAALTDENTPIQPEGNTERLDELDNVFIQVKHPNAIGTFGDFELQKKTGEFGLINTKLQGLEGEFNYDASSGYISVASSRGKYNTNQFNGQDGVQGPYRLAGRNNEPNIILIAGTEKVYLDGMEIKRGENNDYTIDYSIGQITFTTKRLITAASRVTVDFEYTDRQFTRNFFGTGVTTSFLNKKVSLQVQYTREGDDKDAPIDASLTDDDKKILAAAGNDRNKASKSGVSLALPDSLGVIRGVYAQVDTVINSVPDTFYVYKPGDPTALYDVSFSYIGEGQGDYIKQSLGNYSFAGKNQGNYNPVIYLPLPELKQVANFVIDLNPWNGVNLSLEYAGSSWDQNTFSTLDKDQDYGYARNIFFKLDPRKIDIGSISLGKIGFSYKDRFVQDKFTSEDRINEIEFDRNYNVAQTVTPVNEELREVGLNLIPISQLNINSSYGYLNRGPFTSNRFNNSVVLADKNYNFNYNLDYVATEDQFVKSYWLREKGSASYLFGSLKPGIDFLAENRKDKNASSDSLYSGSLKYYEIDPFLKLIDYKGINFSAKYSIREDYAPLSGVMYDQANSMSQVYDLNYNGIKEFQSSLNFTVSNKKYTDAFKQSGNLNSQTILIKSQSRFNFWKPIIGDYYYEVSTQRTAKLQKVFVKVPQGQGNYIYLGDLNNNGIPDENEFEPTVYDGDYVMITVPTDQLYPIIDLKTSSKWKINFYDMFDGKNFIGKVAKIFSTETDWRVEENSQEEDYKKIYLLHFSDFQNPDKTIRGSNMIQQDVFLFEKEQDLNFRFRFMQRKSLDQFSGGIEQAFARERSLRIMFKMIQEMSNQTDISTTDDFNNAPPLSNRIRTITDNSITSDFSYRPERNIEVGFKIKAGTSTDVYPVKPTIINLNSQVLRFNLSFAGSGRLRIELERDELIGNIDNTTVVPFELLGANQIGKNYFWRLNFDYRLSTNLQSTVSYDGRLQGQSKAIHTAKAEVRAFF
jgi:hypothetical protein